MAHTSRDVDTACEDPKRIDNRMNPVVEDCVIAESNKLKEKANKMVTANRFREAIDLYTEAMEVGYISDQMTVKLYCNRALAAINWVKNGYHGDTETLLQKATSDSKHACSLAPTDGKTHYRLGCVLYLRRRYKKASIAFEQARIYLPHDKIIEESLAKSQEKLGVQNRRETENTAYIPGGRINEELEQGA